MKTLRRLWTGLLLVAICAAASGQVPDGDEGTDGAERVEREQEFRRVIVKRYTDLTAEAVWRASDAGSVSDVRFRDTFLQRLRVPRSQRILVVGRQRYRVAGMFTTESNLCGIVVFEDEESRRKLGELKEGQQIRIEGTTIGLVGARRAVLVDRILTGNEEKSIIRKELEVRWPGADPQLLIKPGGYDLEFPSHYKQGETERFHLVIQEWRRDEWEARTAAEAAREREEREAEQPERPERPNPFLAEDKTYSEYRADAVYELLMRGDVENVRFRDKYKGTTPGMADLRAIRLPNGQPLDVATVIDTNTGIALVVPADKTELVQKVAQLVPAQDIIVEGTTLGRVGAARAVLLDDVRVQRIAGSVQQSPLLWVVTVYWRQDMAPKRLDDFGHYELALPSSYAEGRPELLVLELREVRLVPTEPEEEQVPPVAPPGG